MEERVCGGWCHVSGYTPGCCLSRTQSANVLSHICLPLDPLISLSDGDWFLFPVQELSPFCRFHPQIQIPEYSLRSSLMQWTGGSTELAADGSQIKTVCCIKCASHDDLICYGGCLHVLCAGCSCANLRCPVGGCGGKDPLSLHQLATLPGWRHLTLDSSAFAEGMARELSTIGCFTAKLFFNISEIR